VRTLRKGERTQIPPHPHPLPIGEREERKEGGK